MAEMTAANIALMEGAKSEKDWNDAIDVIKKEHGGQYPDDWYPKIIMSGLGDRVAARWGTKIGVATIRR